MGIGRVGDMLHGSSNPLLDAHIGGRLVQEPKNVFCLGRVFVVDVVASLSS